MIMIDPIAALEAVNKAVKMVKMASKTASDVSQLGPLLGNYFDAKATATKAARQAKKKGGSNLGAAMQIEMSQGSGRLRARGAGTILLVQQHGHLAPDQEARS